LDGVQKGGTASSFVCTHYSRLKYMPLMQCNGEYGKTTQVGKSIFLLTVKQPLRALKVFR
jgi:hypothetical protein